MKALLEIMYYDDEEGHCVEYEEVQVAGCDGEPSMLRLAGGKRAIIHLCEDVVAKYEELKGSVANEA